MSFCDALPAANSPIPAHQNGCFFHHVARDTQMLTAQGFAAMPSAQSCRLGLLNFLRSRVFCNSMFFPASPLGPSASLNAPPLRLQTHNQQRSPPGLRGRFEPSLHGASAGEWHRAKMDAMPIQYPEHRFLPRCSFRAVPH